MGRALARVLLATILALLPALAPAQTPATDPEVARGIKLVDEGEYDGAILALDAAARRLARQPGGGQALSEAYLYLGVAYLAKGHETSARARFRDALAQVRTLNLSPDRFAPKVVEVFEKAREEMKAAGAEPAPTVQATPAPAAPPKKGGGSKALLIVGAAAAVGGGAALAAGGGGGSSSSSSSGSGSGLRTTSFPNETLRVGAGRDFVVTVNGAGTLTAKVSWVQAGLQLGMYIVALSNTPQVLGEGNQSGSNEMMLSIPVTAQVYRISVTHSSGLGAQVDATITLTVQHP
jgi:hypothetical protein